MSDDTLIATVVPLPPDSRATAFYRAPNLADAYALQLPANASHDPEVLARFMFTNQAPWVARLLWLRDRIMGRFGVKTSDQLRAGTDPDSVRRVGFFRIYAHDAHEILLGEDDSHLDFRVSVRCEPNGGAHRVVATTVVQCHNLLGRLYILVIAPFHRRVVRSALQRAARRGWPPKQARP